MVLAQRAWYEFPRGAWELGLLGLLFFSRSHVLRGNAFLARCAQY